MQPNLQQKYLSASSLSFSWLSHVRSLLFTNKEQGGGGIMVISSGCNRHVCATQVGLVHDVIGTGCQTQHSGIHVFSRLSNVDLKIRINRKSAEKLLLPSLCSSLQSPPPSSPPPLSLPAPFSVPPSFPLRPLSKTVLTVGHRQTAVKPKERHKTAFRRPGVFFSGLACRLAVFSAAATLARMMRSVSGGEFSHQSFLTF